MVEFGNTPLSVSESAGSMTIPDNEQPDVVEFSLTGIRAREFEDRSEALPYRFLTYQTYTGYDSFSIDEWSLGLRWEKTY